MELSYPDDNYGIKLTNGERFVVSPGGAELHGSMQPANAVMVTGTRYADEMPTMTPASESKMTRVAGAEDKTQQTGLKSYDK